MEKSQWVIPKLINCTLIDRTSNQNQSVFPHTHKKELELFYVYAGQGQYMVDHHLYSIRAGDLVICNAGILHGEEPNLVRQIHSYSIAVSGVQLEGLPPNCLIARTDHPVVNCGQLTEHIGHLMQLIYLLSSDPTHLQEVCSGFAYSMLLLIKAMLDSRAHSEAIAELEQPSVLAHRVRKYLDEYYNEQITLHDVAEQLHISEYYLAHVFKKEFGSSPMKYVMKRRIGGAQEMLMNTDLPIAAIADRLGYCSVCHFNAVFKKQVGLAPGQFRQSFRKDNS